jgi:anthranilate/para-aminobenzoate synthase component II
MLSRLLTLSFTFHLYPYLAAIVKEETKLQVSTENVSPESSVVISPGNRITPGPPQTWNYFDNWVSEFLHLILMKIF